MRRGESELEEVQVRVRGVDWAMTSGVCRQAKTNKTEQRAQSAATAAPACCVIYEHPVPMRSLIFRVSSAGTRTDVSYWRR